MKSQNKARSTWNKHLEFLNIVPLEMFYLKSVFVIGKHSLKENWHTLHKTTKESHLTLFPVISQTKYCTV